MKTIIINKRDLKNKNYSNSKVIIEDRDEPNINMDNELADFLFSCFKVMRETKESLDTSKTIGFILSMPKTIVKESICLNIIVLKEDLETMKENIVKGDRIDSTLFMEPADFLIMKNQQEMMTSPELSEYISRQRQRGFANIKEFEIEYHKRIAMSFASFILTLIGVSLSSKKTKGGMGLHLGIGLALSFSYILFQTIASTFAVNGNVPPVIAVWIPNILYAFIAFYLYQKAPK